MTGPGRFRVGAYGLCEDHAGSVLLAQIYPHDPYAGQWTLPGGGMDWGESPLETLHREFEEETGLTVEAAELIHVESTLFEAWRDIPAMHHVQVVYRVLATGDPIVEADGSTVDVAWVAADEWPALTLVPWVREVLERFT